MEAPLITDSALDLRLEGVQEGVCMQSPRGGKLPTCGASTRKE